MTEPWFSPEVARSFALLSFLAVGAGLTIYAKRGQHRALVLTAGAVLVAFGAILLLAALAASAIGQPAFVSRPLLLSGVVITGVCASGWFELRKMYAEAELRKVSAADI